MQTKQLKSDFCTAETVTNRIRRSQQLTIIRILTSEEDFAQEVNNIRQRYWDDLLHNYQLTEEQRTEIQKEQAEAQTDAEKKSMTRLWKCTNNMHLW